MKCTYSCHSPEHTMARREFLAGMAATAAGSMVGGLGVFSQPLAAAQLDEGSEADRRLQHARRLEPARELGPQAGHGDRRPLPRDQHVGTRNPGLRAAAERRQADAPPLPGARGEHQRGRPRQGGLPDDDRAAADPRRRLPEPRGRLRQGHGPRRGAHSPATSSSPRAAAAAAATTPPTWARNTRASTWATASRPAVHHPARTRSPSRWTPPATPFVDGSTTGSSTAGARPSPKPTPIRTSRRSS